MLLKNLKLKKNKSLDVKKGVIKFINASKSSQSSKVFEIQTPAPQPEEATQMSAYDENIERLRRSLHTPFPNEEPRITWVEHTNFDSLFKR
ncbi:MAG: hypothetical protein HOH19_00680 [Kordiimonadaceae bacterium]|jgi:hypothetical protein|nr:hypothetical protein [Kordiimonadaceae bacterium]MBT6031064.1 hypothetical protein [Kordiimonadaceae bacterium]